MVNIKCPLKIPAKMGHLILTEVQLILTEGHLIMTSQYQMSLEEMYGTNENDQ